MLDDAPVQIYPEPPIKTPLPVAVVVPYDMAMDRELRRFTQDGYGFEQLDLLFTRTPFEPLAVTVEQAREISRPEHIKTAVEAVAATGPRGYLYACTSGSFVHGLAGEQRMVSTIASAGAGASSTAREAVGNAGLCGDPESPLIADQLPFAVSTSGALLEAVMALEVNKFAAATPYDEATGALFGSFFAQAGIELVHTANMGLSGRIWTVGWESVCELIIRADHPEAEAVLVACTNLPTYEVLDQLEQSLNKPVISANQATIWAALTASSLEYFGPGRALRDLKRPQHRLTSTGDFNSSATSEPHHKEAPS